MHFITGGAFHGKRRWVIDTYQLKACNSYKWISGYERNKKNIASSLESLDNSNVLILEGVEQIIYDLVAQQMYSEESFRKLLSSLIMWEESQNDHQLILIGTDISKGIVPMDRLERQYRDEVGRCYQYLSEKAEQVSLIWYGLHQKLK